MTIWGVTGHMDLGPTTRRLVAAEVFAELARHGEPGDDDLVGMTCLAGGADQVFAWVICALGGELVFVRPCARVEETATGADLRGMRAGAAMAAEILQLPYDEPSDEAFEAGGMEVVRRCERLIAVWDGAPPRGRGGTHDIVAYARAAGRDPIVIWPDGARRG